MNSIRVDEIPGGVWKRAPLITPDGNEATLVAGQEAIVVVPAPATANPADYDPDNYYSWEEVADDWHIDLSDPLGLTGLAGQVVRRLRLSLAVTPSPVIHGLAYLSSHLVARPWMPDPCTNAVINAAQHLALTDRLCAASGLKLEPGDVARWSRLAHQEDQRWNLWELHSSGGREQWELDADDWLTALRSAVEGAHQ